MTVCSAIGFYYTGSGAVMDLMKECDDIYVNDKFEIRFAYDPDGISDLEFNLIDNPNKHNGSTAIKRFREAMDKLDHIFFYDRYRKLVDPLFLKHTSEYLDDIIAFSQPGYYHYDIWGRGKVFYIANGFIKLISRGKRSLISNKERNYYGIYDRELFYNSTKRYTDKVLNGLNKDNKQIVFADQIVPAANFDRYTNYFQNLRIVLVDRDPRDVYITGKVVVKDKVMPKEVNEFCEWYQWNRTICYRKKLPEYVLKIQFEDLIYNYRPTVKMIFNHYGISAASHVNKGKFFNKEISQGNTMLWKRFVEYEKDVRIIEKKLAGYCYDFPDNVLEISKVRAHHQLV